MAISQCHHQGLNFRQLYVIWAPLGNTAVSTVFALQQTKSQDIYEILLQAVVDHCHEIMLYADPTTIIVDFEQAVIQALTVFLDHIQLRRITFITWHRPPGEKYKL